MDMSASVGEVNVHHSAGLSRLVHARRVERLATLEKAPTPAPAPIMSDATESSESTCERTAPTLMRKRGSSWSLARETAERQTKIAERTHDSSSSVEKAESPSVAQHEIKQHPPCEVEFVTMSQLGNEALLKRLADASMRGNLTMINFTRRGLGVNDAGLIQQAIYENPHLSVLKLGYNHLRDDGTTVIASAFFHEQQHHSCLSLLDLGFNGIGEEGCAALALHAVAGNFVLRTLCLTGNNVREKGALSLAGAILHGSGLKSLHLTANRIGVVGTKALTRAITEGEGRHQLALSSSDDVAITAAGTIQELHLTATGMGSPGFLSVSNMILTNYSLRVLCLSNNGIDDSDMALFSQSLGQNKSLPLEVLKLSFNKISCLGVECLMNAVWGSKTLRVMSLDHNRLGDRGAQLAAVVLTSIDLEVLDLSFNRIGSLGVKALMKSLSENSSLLSLILSGIQLDAAASKAVCYALAYNQSLRTLHADSCSIGYAAQRHIVAGIVSNRQASLHVLTGFQLGAIAVTLGLPKGLEDWRNDQILAFVRLMWRCWRQRRLDGPGRLQRQGYHNEDTDWDQSLSDNVSSEEQESESTLKTEPADPKTVVTASKLAMASLGESGGDELRIEPYQREKAEASPLIPVRATLLERTISGSVQIPSFDHLGEKGDKSLVDSEFDPFCEGDVSLSASVTSHNKEALKKKRNLLWLRKNCWVLNEIPQLPFNDADFFQLKRYFYSPTDDAIGVVKSSNSKHLTGKARGSALENRSPLPFRPREPKISLKQSSSNTKAKDEPASNQSVESGVSFQSKRHSSEMKDDDDIEVLMNDMEPASKRPKNSELRISRYPRIWKKLEFHIGMHAQDRALALMRQLRFVGDDVATIDSLDEKSKAAFNSCKFAPCDVETILLDLQ